MIDPGQIIKAFLILFAVIDVVGSIPLVLQVREKAGKIYPARAVLVSLGIMITFLFLGEGILQLLGIDVRSFAVAGALVLFFIALEMILGVRLFKEDLSAPGLTDGKDDNKVYSIVPLAFPVIAGAGSITTILSLRAEFDSINILIAIVLNIVPVTLVLLLTSRIERLLGRVGLIVIKKAFGVILLAGSVPAVPEKLASQLEEGGRLACIVASGYNGKVTIRKRVGETAGDLTPFDAWIPRLEALQARAGFAF